MISDNKLSIYVCNSDDNTCSLHYLSLQETPLVNTYCRNCITLDTEVHQLKSTIKSLKIKIQRKEKDEGQLMSVLGQKADISFVSIGTLYLWFYFGIAEYPSKCECYLSLDSFLFSIGCQTEEDVCEEMEQEIENDDYDDLDFHVDDPSWTPQAQKDIDHITECTGELPMEEEPITSTIEDDNEYLQQGDDYDHNTPPDCDTGKENLNHR